MTPHRERARRMTPHKSEAWQAEKNAAPRQTDLTLEVTLYLWGCHGQEEWRTAKILMRLSQPEQGDNKGRLPNTTH